MIDERSASQFEDPLEAADPLLARRLERHLAALPAVARLVVILRFQEDLDPAEIAGVLDLSVNTVKSHLKRSLARLRADLSDRDTL
jgi:RNA polymerase sigma-70 factor, ECF subfamily